MGMGNGEGYASRPARWLEEKEEDGRPEQHGVGAAVGPVGADAGGGRVGELQGAAVNTGRPPAVIDLSRVFRIV